MNTTTKEMVVLRGVELRYVLIVALRNQSEMTVGDLVEEIARQGFKVDGRPSKVISDALRAELARERVVRVERGTYALGQLPRSTEHRILARAKELRARAETGMTGFERWLEALP